MRASIEPKAIGLVMLVRHRQIIVPGAGGRSMILLQRPTQCRTPPICAPTPRNTAWRKGEKMPRADGARLFDVMRIISANFARPAHLNPPLAGISGPADFFSLRVISKA